jgi:hypothetical protein
MWIDKTTENLEQNNGLHTEPRSARFFPLPNRSPQPRER